MVCGLFGLFVDWFVDWFVFKLVCRLVYILDQIFFGTKINHYIVCSCRLL